MLCRPGWTAVQMVVDVVYLWDCLVCDPFIEHWASLVLGICFRRVHGHDHVELLLASGLIFNVSSFLLFRWFNLIRCFIPSCTAYRRRGQPGRYITYWCAAFKICFVVFSIDVCCSWLMKLLKWVWVVLNVRCCFFFRSPNFFFFPDYFFLLDFFSSETKNLYVPKNHASPFYHTIPLGFSITITVLLVSNTTTEEPPVFFWQCWRRDYHFGIAVTFFFSSALFFPNICQWRPSSEVVKELSSHVFTTISEFNRWSPRREWDCLRRCWGIYNASGLFLPVLSHRHFRIRIVSESAEHNKKTRKENTTKTLKHVLVWAACSTCHGTLIN